MPIFMSIFYHIRANPYQYPATDITRNNYPGCILSGGDPRVEIKVRKGTVKVFGHNGD